MMFPRYQRVRLGPGHLPERRLREPQGKLPLHLQRWLRV